MIATAIVGFGNIGRAVYEALGSCGDMRLAGIVSGSLAPGALGDVPAFVRSTATISIPRFMMFTAGWMLRRKPEAALLLWRPAGIPGPIPLYGLC